MGLRYRVNARIFRIAYNSPVILSFTLIAGAVFIADQMTGQGLIKPMLSASPYFMILSPMSYVRLFSYTVVHQNWVHLSDNFMIILLVGPLLEEKYGSLSIFIMMLLTAFLASIINIFLVNAIMIGASGIVFMFIVLSSFTNLNYRYNGIPLTFILVASIFMSNEFLGTLAKDNIAHFAHIAGGICGALFGSMINQR